SPGTAHEAAGKWMPVETDVRGLGRTREPDVRGRRARHVGVDRTAGRDEDFAVHHAPAGLPVDLPGLDGNLAMEGGWHAQRHFRAGTDERPESSTGIASVAGGGRAVIASGDDDARGHGPA